MSRRRIGRGNVSLAVVWGLLVVVAIVARQCGGGRLYDRPEATAERVFPQISAAEIARIEIDGPVRSAVLERSGEDRWRVASENDYPADPNAMARVLEEIVSLPRGRIASSEPDPLKLADYGLSPGERIDVRVRDREGELLAAFAVGKVSEDYRSCFVQLGGEQAIRRIYRVIRNAFGQSEVATFRDSTILDVEVRAITGMVIEGSHGRIELVKEPATPDAEADPAAAERWRMETPREGRADDILIRRLETRVSPLLAESWAADGVDPADVGLSPARVRITLRLEDGSERILEVGQGAGEGKRYVKSADAPTIFIVPDWRVDDFDRDVDAFLLEDG